MACATLKRTQNFDIVDTAAIKRRRYTECKHSCGSTLGITESPFVPREATTHVQLKRRIKEEIKRMQRRRLIPKFLGVSFSGTSTGFNSPAKDENSVTSCSGILRSMALQSPKRDAQDSDGERSPVSQTEATISKFACNESSPNSSAPVSTPRPPRNIDTVPIFTLPQVTSLCDRLIKEREDELRQEYDTILSCKLAEQYEAFLKFSHDQLYSRFQNTPMSYVS